MHFVNKQAQIDEFRALISHLKLYLLRSLLFGFCRLESELCIVLLVLPFPRHVQRLIRKTQAKLNCSVLYFLFSGAFGLFECMRVPFSKNASCLWLLSMGSYPSLSQLTQFLAADTPTFMPSLQRAGGAVRKRAQRARRGAFCQLKNKNSRLEVYFNRFIFFIQWNFEILPEGKSPEALEELSSTFLSNADLVLFSCGSIEL